MCLKITLLKLSSYILGVNSFNTKQSQGGMWFLGGTLQDDITVYVYELWTHVGLPCNLICIIQRLLTSQANNGLLWYTEH